MKQKIILIIIFIFFLYLMFFLTKQELNIETFKTENNTNKISKYVKLPKTETSIKKYFDSLNKKQKI